VVPAAESPVARLSVVVPSVNGWSDLEGCLAALDRQRADITLEVLVVDRLGEALRARVADTFSWAVVIPVPTETTIPDMRACAFAQCTGDAVAVIEDHVIVPDGWARALVAALNDGHDVVGGAVENAATETLLDWAAFLCEYSHCVPPLPAGPVAWLTGNNVAYRRVLLEQCRDVLGAGRWENVLHDALRARGVELVCRPEIVVGHKKHYTFGEYLTQRYLYARSFAGARVASEPLTKRLAYGVAAFGLAPVLYWRIVTRVLKKGRHTDRLWPSLPLLVPFVLSWAWGEVVGYWRGPGTALSRVC